MLNSNIEISGSDHFFMFEIPGHKKSLSLFHCDGPGGKRCAVTIVNSKELPRSLGFVKKCGRGKVRPDYNKYGTQFAFIHTI